MRIVLSTALAAIAMPALAQNTTGVFGPTVDADDHSIQYRVAITDESGANWGQRIHYERAVNDRFRPRIVLATKERGGNQVDLDFVRLEAVYQLTPDDRPWQRGLRFEARFRDEGAEEVRVNLANQWVLGDGWRARAIWLNTLQIADRTNEELQFSTRLGLSRKLDSGVRVGVHGYFGLGDTGGLELLTDAVDSEAGPFVGFDLSDRIGVYVGTLHGFTDASPDNQFRVFLSRDF